MCVCVCVCVCVYFCVFVCVKLKSKLKAARAEMADYREEQIKVREDLALSLESLQREQKLRY